jgi:hypothetical protein
MLDSKLYFHCHVDFVYSQALKILVVLRAQSLFFKMVYLKTVCPSTALVRDPAEVLAKVAYELGVSALNLVQVYPQFKNVLSAIEQFCVN